MAEEELGAVVTELNSLPYLHLLTEPLYEGAA
jgi:hypothetical protein